MTLDVTLIPLLSDNYSYFLRDAATGQTAIIDPAEAEPVLAFLRDKQLPLHFILNTHHHGDHVGGNLILKERTGAPVVGPAYDRARIPGLDIGIDETQTFLLGASEFRVFHIPGHTTGHIAFYNAASSCLFAGDTLFSMGCGRLFEGTPAMMWASLQRLRALPGDTLLYCGHEYTVKNATFALRVDPQNPSVRARLAAAEACRARNAPTLPARMQDECSANPFLRADDPALARALNLNASDPAIDPASDPVSVFAKLRALRDKF